MLYLTFFEPAAEKRYQKEHKAGQRLLQFALREEYGITDVPMIDKRECGKPYFPEYEQIQFNISHTAGIAVCAVGLSELGVDIERVRPVSSSMAERVFTKSERNWMQGQEKKEEAAIRLWTLKESYVKATGQGLRTILTEVEFTLPDFDSRKEICCNKKEYCFFQQKAGDSAYLALCLRAEEIPLEMKKLHIIF